MYLFFLDEAMGLKQLCEFPTEIGSFYGKKSTLRSEVQVLFNEVIRIAYFFIGNIFFAL